MNTHGVSRRKFITRTALTVIFALSVYAASMCASYYIVGALYSYFGWQAPLAKTVVTGLCAVCLLVLFVLTITTIHRKSEKADHRSSHETMMNALNEISRGNFNVLIDVSGPDPHTELAAAINDMTRNLGSLETMRQDFISNVSHEIQSPLTSIAGFAALLKNAVLPYEERRRYADIIVTESKRLSSLSENLLKLSSLDSGEGGASPLNKREFRLDRQIENIALTLEPQWAVKEISVEADLSKQVITGDEDLLSQVWINLLHNAIKFTPKGGKICITMKDKTPGGVIVEISDNGVGIAPEDLVHIFERFYKADKARDRSLGGNGLGLSLVKRIVETHGGAVSVRSDPGVGTVFEVALG